MPDLTGTKISNTYKRLMQVKSSDNEGITSSLQTIQSGDNVDSPLQLSNSTLNVNGTFAIGGVNLTADQDARLQRLEQKVDKLMKHLGVK